MRDGYVKRTQEPHGQMHVFLTGQIAALAMKFQLKCNKQFSKKKTIMGDISSMGIVTK